MTKNLHNILWTALVTPFDHHGNVDLNSFNSLIKRQEDAGNALLLFGSTGEGLAISECEKKRAVEHLLTEPRKTPVMIGVGGHRIDEQISWMHFCNKFSIDAFLLVTPYYAKPGYCGQMKWFSELFDASQVPCMLYNIPSRAGCSLHLDAVKDLSSHPKFWGLKEASGSNEVFQQYRKVLGGKPIYCGNDSSMWDVAEADGLVGVMSNLWPKATRSFVEGCLKKERTPLVDEALEASRIANQMNPLASKMGLFRGGYINCPDALPPLSIQDFQETERLKTAHQNLLRWEQPVSVS